MTAPSKPAATPEQNPQVNAAVPVRTSLELLGLQGALRIDHQGAIYTLRTTSKGGLLLTK